jgi:predicted nucleic acid-binding protein
MKLLIDVNVVLDAVLMRQPWAKDAAVLLASIEQRRAEGFLAGHTVTTAYYVAAKTAGRPSAVTAISDLLRVFEVVPVEKDDFFQALALGWTDFEDAVQAICALKVNADYIVTRNARDFQNGPIATIDAGAVLGLIRQE